MKNYSVFILFFILLFNCSSDDSSDSSFVNDFTIEMDENPTNNQLIGLIPHEVGESEQISSSILTQSVPNAVYVFASGLGGSDKIYVSNPILFDFETNPIIKVTLKVNKVIFIGNYEWKTLDTKTITVTINLNDLPD